MYVYYICMYIIYGVLLISLDGPSAPTGLTSTSPTDTTVSLSWEVPASNGGRTDGVSYTIRFKTLGTDFQDYNPSSIITSTSADISGLSPVTTYTFVVVANNKVTKEFPNEFPPALHTSAELTVTTKSSRELHT